MPEQPRRFSRQGLVRRSNVGRPTRRVIAVAFDGEKTEAEYFRGWARKLGTVGVVLTPFYVRSGGNAHAAVQACIKQAKADGPFDEVWCVCDVDDTSSQNLQSARALAKRENIELCLSSRCFEVWLALHWGKISLAGIQSEREAVALVTQHYSAYSVKDKQVPFELLFERTKAACDNADWLLQQSLQNPHTEVQRLVRKLMKMHADRTRG